MVVPSGPKLGWKCLLWMGRYFFPILFNFMDKNWLPIGGRQLVRDCMWSISIFVESLCMLVA